MDIYEYIQQVQSALEKDPKARKSCRDGIRKIRSCAAMLLICPPGEQSRIRKKGYAYVFEDIQHDGDPYFQLDEKSRALRCAVLGSLGGLLFDRQGVLTEDEKLLEEWLLALYISTPEKVDTILELGFKTIE